MRYGALLCLCSAAMAVPAGAADAPTSAAPPNGAAAPSTAGLDGADAARLNDGLSLRKQMQSGVQVVGNSLGEARNEKDIVKLNYLTGIEKSVLGLVRVADQSLQNLQQALLRHDVAAANHEQEKLTIVADKVKALAQQCQNAVGGLAVYSGDTQVEFFFDESLAGRPHEDPVASTLVDWAVPPLNVERPPAASPYQ